MARSDQDHLRPEDGPCPRPMIVSSDAPNDGFDRVAAVLARARETGLIRSKDGRITGRVSSELIAQAKACTGLRSDSELVEFALASIAVDDGFARIFRELRGSVDPSLDLG